MEQQRFSIDSGLIAISFRPSTYCPLKCAHCDMLPSTRKNRYVMELDKVEAAFGKIGSYFRGLGVERKTISINWNDGEPTAVGPDYWRGVQKVLERVFPAAEGCVVSHRIVSSATAINRRHFLEWMEIFKRYFDGKVTFSYDVETRGGEVYHRLFERAVRETRDAGVDVATSTIVTKPLIQAGAERVFDYLGSLGVQSASFVRLEQSHNNTRNGFFDEFNPGMTAFNDFMIQVGEHFLRRKEGGDQSIAFSTPYMHLAAADGGNRLHRIGFLLHHSGDLTGDLAALEQDGDIKSFGNLLEQSFEEVLRSPARREFIRANEMQYRNRECFVCEQKKSCFNPFFQERKPGDECFGAKRFVEWVMENRDRLEKAPVARVW